MAAVVTLPIALAAGFLAFAPLGPEYVAKGAVAGIWGAVLAGAVAALLATSSFVVTCPRVSLALVQASLALALLRQPAFAGNPALVAAAIALCVLLTGLWQVLIGVFRVATIIKFTPHPVLAGFLNGIGLLIILAQLKPFFASSLLQSRLALPDRPAMLLFVLALTAFILWYPELMEKLPGGRHAKKIPGILAGLVLGIIAYYALKAAAPGLELGSTIGRLDVSFPAPVSLVSLASPEILAPLRPALPEIVLVSLVLAVVATFEGLMAFRLAQNIGDIPVRPVRDMAAQGVANIAGAIFGGLGSTAIPAGLTAAHQSGGRTRWTGVAAAIWILLIGTIFSAALAAIPIAVLAAILLVVGARLFDPWSVKLAPEIWRQGSLLMRRRAIYDLSVVVVVMGVTVMSSVVAGVIAGSLLACVIFIINMSRPVVRREWSGSELFSRRIRPAEDVGILERTGLRRAMLQLEGVLFFGNADALAARLKELFDRADMVALDLAAVSDIDVSGATILRNVAAKAREKGQYLLFCNVPDSQEGIIASIALAAAGPGVAVMRDRDAALEWMEEKTLAGLEQRRTRPQPLPLDRIDFLAGLSERELAALATVLVPRQFHPGEALCREGGEGDRMWLLVKGSVSVRIRVPDQRGFRRITGLGEGTTVGEMALIEGTPRSATIVADDGVVCYELHRSGFATILQNHPAIAAKMLGNLARELSRRLRLTSADLRHTSS